VIQKIYTHGLKHMVSVSEIIEKYRIKDNT